MKGDAMFTQLVKWIIDLLEEATRDPEDDQVKLVIKGTGEEPWRVVSEVGNHLTVARRPQRQWSVCEDVANIRITDPRIKWLHEPTKGAA